MVRKTLKSGALKSAMIAFCFCNYFYARTSNGSSAISITTGSRLRWYNDVHVVYWFEITSCPLSKGGLIIYKCHPQVISFVPSGWGWWSEWSLANPTRGNMLKCITIKIVQYYLNVSRSCWEFEWLFLVKKEYLYVLTLVYSCWSLSGCRAWVKLEVVHSD